LTEQVRQALARQICHQFRVPGQPLSVITFAPPVEERLSEALVQQEGASFIGLEPALSQQIFKRVREESVKLTALGKTPILLTHPQLRLPVRRWMARYVPDVAVLSYNELDPAVEVESGGVVNL
jgi:flagellar biosynthesis protein FlhA